MDRLRAMIPLLFIMLLAAVARPAEKRMPELQRVYHPSNFSCPACDKLKAQLERRGVVLVEVCRSNQSSEPWFFPFAQYSDGQVDSGDLVYKRRCRFAKKVYWITWMEGKKK